MKEFNLASAEHVEQLAACIKQLQEKVQELITDVDSLDQRILALEVEREL